MRGLKRETALLPGIKKPTEKQPGTRPEKNARQDMAAQKAASKNNVTAQDIAAPKTTIQEARERPVTAESQEEVWPPMSEMLHSLLIFEPAVQRPGRSEFDEENRETDGKTSEREVLPPAPVPVVVLGIKSGREELSETQRRLLTNADLLCAGRALLERFVPEAGKKNPPETLLLAAPLEPVYTRIAEARAAGLRVLVLADGDPLFFGIGASLTRLMGRRAVHVIPAVSSLQLACSRLGLPWHDVICLSLHGRNNFGPLNSAISRGAPICLLTDGDIRPDEVARHLLDRGVDWFSAHVFERLDFPDETATHAPLTKAAGMEFGPSCTLVLVPSGPGRMPHLGLRGKDLAAENGIVTKMPVRAAALALLRIAPTHTVWDIGSGSGAMAIEAAVLAHQGRVAAVEKKPERVLCIEENRRRFGAAQVDIYLGEAPSCLEVLPDPQRIFIGGGLSADNGLRTLDHVSRRLPPGGRVVTSCALLNTLSRCRDFFSGQGWPHEIVCVQAAKTRPLADDAHFVAMNPIFVLAAQKPEETP